MKVEITGRHVVITPAIRNYVMKRLRKFSKFVGDDASFHVIIDVEKERHVAEILCKSRMLDLAGKGETGDMYASIVRAVEKIERQAIKNKTRLIETKRQRAKNRSVEQKGGLVRPKSSRRLPQPALICEQEEIQRTLDVEEAAAELEKSEEGFLVFRNLQSGSMNVLYRRKNGSFGLIQE
jgi:putative sigma-54 modulation protein